MNRFPKCFALLGLCLTCANAQAQLQNPGMETPGALQPGVSGAAKVTGQIASGWNDNSNWADVEVDYSLDSTNPHSGQNSQKIEAKRVGAGGAVQFVQNRPLEKGRIYRFSVWLRGLPGQSAQLSLRDAKAPYGTFAATTASLGAEWRLFQVFGQIPEAAEGFLMVRASNAMTLWADDAKLEDLTDARAGGAPKPGNLMPGGSFEAGMGFGWFSGTLERGTAFGGSATRPLRESQARVDASSAATGKRSLRFEMPPLLSSVIRTPAVQTNFGRAHTLSFWAKSSRENTPLQVELAFANGAGQNFTLGPKWTRYSWSFPVPLVAATRFQFAVRQSPSPATLWLDAVQLEEKSAASPAYIPAAPLEMTLQMARFGNIVFADETPSAQLQIAPAPPRSARLRLGYQGLEGAFVPWRTLAAKSGAVQLPTFGGKRGIWNLRAQIVDAGGKALSAPVQLLWSRLPRPREIEAQNSVFGIHLPLQRDYLALARATGQRWNRLHDLSLTAKWPTVEPVRGERDFRDEGVNLAQQMGVKILGMLDGAPEWATTQSRGDRFSYWGQWNIPDAPGALEAWRSYTRTVATHYKGRIDDWEVWNEPWGNWWLRSGNPNATPAFYADLLRIAYDETKRANPKATVIGIDTFPGYDNEWTIPALKAAGTSHYDILSFHDYNDTLYGTTQPRAGEMTARFDELQRQFGTAKPQWMTEGGPPEVGSVYLPATGGLSPAAQPAFMVRYDVSHLAAGTRKIFLYSVRSGTAMGETGYQAVEQDGAIRPILAARAVLASLIDGTAKPTRRATQKGVDRYDFPTQNGRQVSVLWAYDGANHSISLPKGTRALDVWGNDLKTASVSVGFEPVYLVK